AILFCALDDRPLYHAVGQVRIAVRANAVGGVEFAVDRAVDGVGLALVAKPDEVFFLQETARADLVPSIPHRPSFGGDRLRDGWRIRPVGRRGQLASYVVARILGLADKSR